MTNLIVINLGLPKSGTTTLAKALRRAGLRCADHRVRPRKDGGPSGFVADLLYQGYFHADDPLVFLSDFNALSEISLLRRRRALWPQMDWALLSSIIEKHPDIRFLASRRDARAMSESMLGWSDLGTRRLPRASAPGLPPGFGTTTAERTRWIDGHYATLARFFAGSDRYLAYDTASDDAPAQISSFLGIDLPWWGRANANANRAAA